MEVSRHHHHNLLLHLAGLCVFVLIGNGGIQASSSQFIVTFGRSMCVCVDREWRYPGIIITIYCYIWQVYVCLFVQVVGGIRASSVFHHQVLTSALRAPMSFYDTTPVGRIVNRFSKDVDIIDTLIPKNFNMWFMCTYKSPGHDLCDLVRHAVLSGGHAATSCALFLGTDVIWTMIV